MQLAAFAFDYDGTLAHDGRVAEATVDALRRLKAAGVRLLLLSGRELPDLQDAFPRYETAALRAHLRGVVSGAG
jgi:HAD superfamily hydrolase (TIGR01484 family)